MIIRKRFERLVNTGNFENVKVGVEIESEFTLKEGLKGQEKIEEIKNKGLTLGKIAQSIVDQEVKSIIEKKQKETEHVE